MRSTYSVLNSSMKEDLCEKVLGSSSVPFNPYAVTAYLETMCARDSHPQCSKELKRVIDTWEGPTLECYDIKKAVRMFYIYARKA